MPGSLRGRRTVALSLIVAATALGLAGSSLAKPRKLPFKRTEQRERCANFERIRQPFFGDTHVHTSYSFDANINGNTMNDPRDAYEFARGMLKHIPDDGGERDIRLTRPLDFAAVTDHSEYFGETRICTDPTSPGYTSLHCEVFRHEADPPGDLDAFDFWGLNLIEPDLGEITACDTPGICDSSAATVWGEIQAAAEEAYDRTNTCTFTSFVAYEYTGSTGGLNGHRNVIFRNDAVPPVPTSAFETGGTNAPALWQALQSSCLDGIERCDVLTIPHNANLSGGSLFPEPVTVEGATARTIFEPLVEIAQIKGSSECRFDNVAGIGAGTEDALCAWENDPRAVQAPITGNPAPPIPDYPLANMVRNVLKSGLEVEQDLGVNPFHFGIIGSTDTHNGTPGAVDEAEPGGTHGEEDDEPEERVSGRNMYQNPGSLAVVWAEENSRDSIFEAMRRRETYGTSGPRLTVRFFGGWGLNPNLCRKRAAIHRAYKVGVPMGSDLRRRKGTRPLRFFVSALKDPGPQGGPEGTNLQRIQIVKGWIDAAGVTHEAVIDVAGDTSIPALIDEETCTPSDLGAAELCEVWEDPDFDPTQRAFYYARVLENPTCRWSTRVCKRLGVNPFSRDCDSQAAIVSQALSILEQEEVDVSACCDDATTDPFLSPTTQERAWTSPIWYRPPEPRRAER